MKQIEIEAVRYETTDRGTVRVTRRGDRLSALGRAVARMSVTIDSTLEHRSTGLGDPNRWTVTLTRPGRSEGAAPLTLTTAYFMGNAHERAGLPIEPEPADVVHSLLLDASAVDAGSFEAWADDFGYDPDSRSAERLYRECLASAERLSAFLTTSERKRLAGKEH